MDYDEMAYTITVNVTENYGNSKLLSAVKMTKEGREATGLVFFNEYMPEPYIPNTGDESNMFAWILVLLASLGVIAKIEPTLNEKIRRF